MLGVQFESASPRHNFSYISLLYYEDPWNESLTPSNVVDPNLCNPKYLAH